MADYSCFFCKHFVHLNPDEDYCPLRDKIVTTFSPICTLFDLEQTEESDK